MSGTTPPLSFSRRLITSVSGEIAGKIPVALAFVWIARTLDLAAYGQVEWALSIVMVLTLAVDAGLTSWGSVQVAARPEEAGAFVMRASALRFALAVPAYVVLLAVAWSFGGPGGEALAIYGITLFFTPFLLQYLFNGLFKPKWSALGQAIRGIVFGLAVVALVGSGSAPSSVATAEVIAIVALACFGVVVVRLVLKLPMRVTSRLNLGGLLADSGPIGGAELAWGLHWYAGLATMGYLAGPEETAWYSAALRVVLALHTLVWLYLYVLLPGLTRAAGAGNGALSALMERSARWSAAAGVGVAVLVSVSAPVLLTTVFGDAFSAAVPVLRGLIWALPIAWVSGHVRYALIAAGHPWPECQAAIAGAAVTIGLTAMLVPGLGGTGAALALVGGTLANGILAWGLARGRVPVWTLDGIAPANR